MTWAIQCENLSKLYKIGKTNVTAAEMVNQKIRGLLYTLSGRKNLNQAEQRLEAQKIEEVRQVVSREQMQDAPRGHFWALHDVDLEISQGDRVGIIGPNGSGKSTLLKILSRITSPTRGQFHFRGRMTSLLEIGTGFHGDLSGRENIFLNGSIMGMRPAEIKQRFEEIVEFSELGDMIDTPVKRYSSGMYVRLAFAVAAHLESEILIVDEVLAVGDADFQRKCADKMLEVGGQGRTLIFVSHNMDAVDRICNKAIRMEHGKIVQKEDVSNEAVSTENNTGMSTVHEVTRAYLKSGVQFVPEIRWENADEAPTFGNCVRLRAVRLLDDNGETRAEYDVKESVTVEVTFQVLEKKWSFGVHIYLKDFTGHNVLASMDNLDLPSPESPREVGQYVQRCKIESPLLNSGDFRVDVVIWGNPPSEENRLEVSNVVSFSLTDDCQSSGVRGNWPNEWPNYLIRPRLSWTISKCGD